MSSPTVLRLTSQPVMVETIGNPVKQILDERVELIGYDMSSTSLSPAEPVKITLYCRVLAGLDEDYPIFVHALDKNRAVRAQGDGQPLNGDYPTSGWLPGEILADTHPFARTACTGWGKSTRRPLRTGRWCALSHICGGGGLCPE
jgi:hypothetical protein